MSDLWWPGDHRAGDLASDEALLRAMLSVEQAWLAALTDTGVSSALRPVDLAEVVTADDIPGLAERSETGGTPVLPLVQLLRERLEPHAPEAARWVHRGLTSQDVLDTAVVLVARDTFARVTDDLRAQSATLAQLVRSHRTTLMTARTLTQAAVPTTFGLVASGWLAGVLGARDAVDGLVFPGQIGGAGGTAAALVELLHGTGAPESVALQVWGSVADRLGLERRPPWHTTRTTITRLGDAAVTCTDAWGHLANDVLTLSRPEIAELAEGTPGGSSTMPDKANPVLSTLVRRAALTTPQLAATLHVAAAEAGDQRSAGPWHAEWATLRDLLRRTVVAGSQTSDLVAHLQVRAETMTARASASGEALLGEQRSMAAIVGLDPSRESATDPGVRPEDYLGLTQTLIDAVLTETDERQS